MKKIGKLSGRAKLPPLARLIQALHAPAICRRNCIMCDHFVFDQGHSRYSELTPGYNWSAECTRKRWVLEPDCYPFVEHGVTTETWRATIRQAETCPEFEPAKD